MFAPEAMIAASTLIVAICGAFLMKSFAEAMEQRDSAEQSVYANNNSNSKVAALLAFEADTLGAL